MEKMSHPAMLADMDSKLGPAKHGTRFVTFHDWRALNGRWQNTNVTGASGYYYQQWLNCYTMFGADNEHCRKCRWVAEQYCQQRQLDEWDDWTKDEHYDVAIGQHFNKIDSEHFVEAANALKAVREKRDELVKSVNAQMLAAAAEDKMFKIRSELALAEDKTAGLKGLISEGKLSDADVQAAIKEKMAQLKVLNDEGKWSSVKSGLLGEFTALAKTLKLKIKVAREQQEKFFAETKKRGDVAFTVPHFRVDWEKPGMYEYATWFGDFVPRTWQYGYTAPDEE